MNTEPSPADRLADRREQVFAVEARVLARLQEKVWAAQWGLAVERLAEALRRSAENRFRGARPTAAEVAAYLQSLHLEDLALACACRDGNAQAWEHFVRQYRQDLYAAARAIVGGAGEARARELADSLYAELYGMEEREGRRRSLFDYFHGRSKISTWLRAVLAQRHVDALRAAQRTESLDAPPEGSCVPRQLRDRGVPADPDRARLLGLLQQALVEALAALASRDRLRLAYYYVHEHTLAEIGCILGEHEATASRHLERTRRGLRKHVEQALRAGTAEAGLHARPRLSEEQIRQCFAYALEEWPYDLTGALGAPAEPQRDALSQGALRAKLGEE